MDSTLDHRNFKEILSDLKEYLQARRVAVTGHLKPVLVEFATSVEKMMIPTDSNFQKPTEQD